MHPADLRLMRLLFKRIREEMEQRTAGVINGSVPDYAEYRSRCGYLRALSDVLEWCEDIERESDPPDPRT